MSKVLSDILPSTPIDNPLLIQIPHTVPPKAMKRKRRVSCSSNTENINKKFLAYSGTVAPIQQPSPPPSSNESSSSESRSPETQTDSNTTTMLNSLMPKTPKTMHQFALLRCMDIKYSLASSNPKEKIQQEPTIIKPLFTSTNDPLLKKRLSTCAFQQSTQRPNLSEIEKQQAEQVLDINRKRLKAEISHVIDTQNATLRQLLPVFGAEQFKNQLVFYQKLILKQYWLDLTIQQKNSNCN